MKAEKVEDILRWDFVSNFIEWVTYTTSKTNVFIGTLILNLIEALKIICRDAPSGRLYIDNLFENLRRIVWTCLPIATLTVCTSSIVYGIHMAPEFYTRGLSMYLGGVVAISLIREGVPVMASLAIITQFCTGVTAQIGSMKITEQIDAMKMSKVQPVPYLLVPLLLSGLIGFPVLVMICILIGLLVSFLISYLLTNITFQLFLSSVFSSVAIKDIFLAITKASFFGFFVNLISYNCGILTVGGSKDVGSSTRLSVILNFATVLVLDYIITFIWI